MSRLQICQGLYPRYDHNVWVVFRPQGSRHDDCLHARHRCATRRHHRLKRTAPGDDRIELFEHSAEIEIWISLNPVKFSFWPSDVTVQTDYNRIPYAPHEVLFESLTVAM